jgi:hypothetical protein
MMPALATLTLVWLGAQKPEGRAKVVLDSWAESKGAKLEEPRSSAPEDVEKMVALSAECDQALDRARDQLTSGDGEAARQTLRQLEQTLRDHPELLQGAWLMAERYRLEGQIAAHDTRNPNSEPSADDAASWDRRADILEGRRATAFGARPRSPKELGTVSVTLAVHGSRKYEVFWDGVGVSNRIESPAGEHHVVIRRGGRAAWSDWISVLTSGTVDVWVADAAPCSSEDLAGVSLAPGGDPVVPSGVRCNAWAVAAPGPNRGTLQLALCSGDRCQHAATSAYETFAESSPGGEPHKKGVLPGWAAWTIAGASVAAATTLVLWGTGAFDRANPPPKVVWAPP